MKPVDRSTSDVHVRATVCEVGYCEQPAVPATSGVPLLCVSHLRAAWQFGNKILAEADIDDAAERAEAYSGADLDMRMTAEFSMRRGFVYFVERDGLIKVGWTANPRRRFGNLMPDRVLVLMHGTMQDEARVHAAFRSAHEFGEWFRPTADLLTFVEGLRASGDVVDEW